MKHDLDCDVDTLPAGWKTDALVAVYVCASLTPPILHYVAGKLVNEKGDSILLARFSEDIGAAWIVFQSQPFDVSLERDLGSWTCSVPGAQASADTAPLAICRAILKAAKMKEIARKV